MDISTELLELASACKRLQSSLPALRGDIMAANEGVPASKIRLWESLQNIAEISDGNRRAVLCLCRNLVFARDPSIAVEFYRDFQEALNVLTLSVKAVERLVEVQCILEKFTAEMKGCPILALSFDKMGEPITTVLLSSTSVEGVNIYVCHRCTVINLQQFMHQPSINTTSHSESGEQQNQQWTPVSKEPLVLECIGAPHESLLDTVALAVHLHCSVAVYMSGLHCLDEGINGGQICMWPWKEEDLPSTCHSPQDSNMPSGNDFTIGVNFKKTGCSIPCVIVTTSFCA